MATPLGPVVNDESGESYNWYQWLKGPGRWSMWILWVCLVQSISTLANSLPSSASTYVMSDLNLTDAQFGTAMGMAYEMPFAIGSLIFAFAVAGGLPIRPHFLLVIGTAIMNVGTTLVGSAYYFGTLCLWRAVAGIGMIMLFPAYGSLLDEICPPENVGVAWSLFLAFITLGASMSSFVVGSLEDNGSWRIALHTVGFIAFCCSPVILFFPPPAPTLRVHVGWRNFRPFRMPETDDTVTLSECFCRAPVVAPALPILLLGALTIDIQGGAWISFGQLWLVNERNMTIPEAGDTTGAALIGGCLTGLLVALFLVDRAAAYFKLNRPQVFAGLMLIILLSSFMETYSAFGSAWFYIGFYLVFMQATVGVGQLFASVQELSPPRIVGTTTAVAQFLVRCGNVFGATVLGFICDALRDGGDEEPYTHVLRIAYSAGAFTIVTALLAARSYEEGKEALNVLVGMPPPPDDIYGTKGDVEKKGEERKGPPEQVTKDGWL